MGQRRYIDLGGTSGTSYESGTTIHKPVKHVVMYWPLDWSTGAERYIEVRVGNTAPTTAKPPHMTTNALCGTAGFDGTLLTNITTVTCTESYGLRGRYISVQHMGGVSRQMALCEVQVRW